MSDKPDFTSPEKPKSPLDTTRPKPYSDYELDDEVKVSRPRELAPEQRKDSLVYSQTKTADIPDVITSDTPKYPLDQSDPLVKPFLDISTADKPKYSVDSTKTLVKPYSDDESVFETEAKKQISLAQSQAKLPDKTDVTFPDKPKSTLDLGYKSDDGTQDGRLSLLVLEQPKDTLDSSITDLSDKPDTTTPDKPNFSLDALNPLVKLYSDNEPDNEIEVRRPTQITPEQSKVTSLPPLTKLSEAPNITTFDKPKSPHDLSNDETEVRKISALIPEHLKDSMFPSLTKMSDQLDINTFNSIPKPYSGDETVNREQTPGTIPETKLTDKHDGTFSDKLKSPFDSSKPLGKQFLDNETDDEREVGRQTALAEQPIDSSIPSLTVKFDKSDGNISDRVKTPLDSTDDQIDVRKATAIIPDEHIESLIPSLIKPLDKPDITIFGKAKYSLDSAKSLVKPYSDDEPREETEYRKRTGLTPELPKYSLLRSQTKLSDEPDVTPSDKPKSSLDERKLLVKSYSDDESDNKIEDRKSSDLTVEQDKDSLLYSPTKLSDISFSDRHEVRGGTQLTSEQPKDALVIPLTKLHDKPDITTSDEPKSPLDSAKPLIKASLDDEVEVNRPTGLTSENPKYSIKKLSVKPDPITFDMYKSPLDLGTTLVKPHPDDESADEAEVGKQTILTPEQSKDLLVPSLEKLSDQPDTISYDKSKFPLDSTNLSVKRYLDDDSNDEAEASRQTGLILEHHKDEIALSLPKLSDIPHVTTSDKLKYQPDFSHLKVDTYLKNESDGDTDLDRSSEMSKELSKDSLLPSQVKLSDKAEVTIADKTKSPLDSTKTLVKPYGAPDDARKIRKPTALTPKQSKDSSVPSLIKLSDVYDVITFDNPNPPLGSTKALIKPNSGDESNGDIEVTTQTVLTAEKPKDSSALSQKLSDKLDVTISDNDKSERDSTKPLLKPYSDDESDDHTKIRRPTELTPEKSSVKLFPTPDISTSDKPKDQVDSTMPLINPYAKDVSDDRTEVQTQTGVTPEQPKDSRIPLAKLPDKPRVTPSDKPKSLLDSLQPLVKTYSDDESDTKTELKRPTEFSPEQHRVPLVSSLANLSDKPDSIASYETKTPLDLTKPFSNDKPDDISNVRISTGYAPEQPTEILTKISEKSEVTASDTTKSPLDSRMPLINSDDEKLSGSAPEKPDVSLVLEKTKPSVDPSKTFVRPSSVDELDDVTKPAGSTAVQLKDSLVLSLTNLSSRPEDATSGMHKSSLHSTKSLLAPYSNSKSVDETEVIKSSGFTTEQSEHSSVPSLTELYDKADTTTSAKHKSPLDTTKQFSNDETEITKAIEKTLERPKDSLPPSLKNLSEKSDVSTDYESDDEIEIRKSTELAPEQANNSLAKLSDKPAVTTSDKSTSSVDPTKELVEPFLDDKSADKTEVMKVAGLTPEQPINPLVPSLIKLSDLSDVTTYDKPKSFFDLTIAYSNVDSNNGREVVKSLGKVPHKPDVSDSPLELTKPLGKSYLVGESDDETDVKKEIGLTLEEPKDSLVPPLTQHSDKPDFTTFDEPKSSFNSAILVAKPCSDDAVEVRKPLGVYPTKLSDKFDVANADKLKPQLGSTKPILNSHDVSDVATEVIKPTVLTTDDPKSSFVPSLTKLFDKPDVTTSDRSKSPLYSTKKFSDEESDDEVEVRKPTSLTTQQPKDSLVSFVTKLSEKSDFASSDKPKPYSDDESEDEANNKEILRSPVDLNPLEVANSTLSKNHAVACFVDLKKSGQSKTIKTKQEIKPSLGNKKGGRSIDNLNSNTSKVDAKVSSLKSKDMSIDMNKPKVAKSAATEFKSKKYITQINNQELLKAQSSPLNQKPLKNIKKSVAKDYERIITDKTKLSSLNNQIRLERTLSPQTNNTYDDKKESTIHSTIPRPRVRTDITRLPQNQTLRTFSPPPNHPKSEYPAVTSVHAHIRKSQKAIAKKPLDISPSSRSSTPNEDSQRRRLRTPTSSSRIHHYMQPTIAHSRKYATLKSADSEVSLDEKSTKSPIPPPTVATSSKGFLDKQTKAPSERRKLQTNKQSSSRESIRSTETKMKSTIDHKQKTMDNKLKQVSATKRTQSTTTKEMKASLEKSENSTKTKSITQTSSVRYSRQISKEKQNIAQEKNDKKPKVHKPLLKRDTNKTSTEDSNKLKERAIATYQKRTVNTMSKVPVRTTSTLTSGTTTKAANKEATKTQVKTKHDQKQLTKRSTTTTRKVDSKEKEGKIGDIKVQKKLKNTINKQTGNVKSTSVNSPASSRNRTTTTSKNSQITNKKEKELVNKKLADRKPATTNITSVSTVKLYREPIATTIVSTVVINDDNDSEINARSIRSNESTKSSSSSAGSRKVITSEVFTKTFGPDKPFEVIYRQPEVDYMSIMRPQSVEQRCVNEYDVSFIDTTDSSLSDSVALPTFTSDQDRLCAASPGSPKPTRSPFALIEETIRKQQAGGFALDPTLQRQIEAVGMITSESGSPMLPTTTAIDPESKQETMQEYIPEPQLVSVESVTKQGTITYNIENDKYYDDDNVGDDEQSDDDDDDEDDEEDDEHEKSVIDTESKNQSDFENVRREATVLVDNVLEECIHIVNEQQDRDHIESYNFVVDSNNKLEYNSESENYAITCDDVDGLDVIKSPTIESMSGKSFDDNMSFTDENIVVAAAVTTALPTTSPTTTTTSTTTFSMQPQRQQLLPQEAPSQSGDEICGTEHSTQHTSLTKEFKN